MPLRWRRSRADDLVARVRPVRAKYTERYLDCRWRSRSTASLAVVRARIDLHAGAGYPIIGFSELVVVNVVRHVRQ